MATGNKANGERFIPWRRFTGIIIPDPVMRSGLSLGAKVCYGVLARFAGQDGHCFPTMRTIGAFIGVCERQAKSYIQELAREGFISRQQRGKARSNQYDFLRHGAFDGQESARMKGSILPGEGKDSAHIRESPKENQLSRDLDCVPTNRKKKGGGRGKKKPQEKSSQGLEDGKSADKVASTAGMSHPSLERLSDLVQRMLGEEVEMLGEEVTRSSLERIISATPNKVAYEAFEAVQDAERRGYGADSKHAPRSVSWFKSVVQNYWEDRSRRALPPSSAQGSSSQFHEMMNSFDTLGD